MKTYQDFVQAFTTALEKGKQLPLGGIPPLPHPSLPGDAKKVLLFSPHPDDEVIVGGLALRLRRELKMRVVTQGSSQIG